METNKKTVVPTEISTNTKSANVMQQKTLEEVKEYFKQKEQKIKLLESIEENLEKLTSTKAKNEGRSEVANYFTEQSAEQTLTLSGMNEYSRTDKIFSVTNPWLIDEVLSLLLKKMEFKADTLRAEIMA